jgi:hypothetical protein
VDFDALQNGDETGECVRFGQKESGAVGALAISNQPPPPSNRP